jgi:uncharacterized protein
MNVELILGLATGIAFGFILQKARVLRFEKQLGALLFKDMTIIKFMFSAIAIGMIGIFILSDIGFIQLSHKSMNVGGVLIGGGLFGIGWAIFGYCPGTAMGAVGEGRWSAVFGIFGMLLGAGIYAELYPFFKTNVLAWSDLGKVSISDVTGVPYGLLVIGFLLCLYFLISWCEGYFLGLRIRQPRQIINIKKQKRNR